MKTLIISDLHLTYFKPKKCAYLLKLFAGFDQIIINGDLWSYYSITFDEFVKSKWSQLFPILKQKNTIYLFGNHDKQKYCDTRVNLFSTQQAQELKLKVGSETLNITHGQKMCDLKEHLNETIIAIQRKLRFDTLIRYPLETFFVRTHLLAPAIASRLNAETKAYKQAHYPATEWLVIGHTHLPELDHNLKYINTGVVNHGVVSYLSITDTTFELIYDTY